ncbi:hypothetical protein JYK14_16285 [Siccirubricoccus sp. KC 17139]|uniref:Uncharacterized protein n=1 Tax=Siccirubricoccus soli TaxID=2899147 RepID=A0ABT1D706_9PROT|nr:hypothetical protein [Siccirubricoccus soli]MCO6417708.1 hypothetical protein [Siccirubricoccus soli]MCP2683843.1 hypothetical protein [Siccirubricoccus soli]
MTQPSFSRQLPRRDGKVMLLAIRWPFGRAIWGIFHMFRALPPLAAALLSLGACGVLPPPPPSAQLPYDATVGAGDPIRAAAATTSYSFSHQETLAGQPAAAARALAQMEFLAADLPTNPRFPNMPPELPSQLAEARAEWRQALGVPRDLPPQPVIDSLYAAARALNAGQPAANAAATLPANVFTQGGEATLTRLAALPPLPQTGVAATTSAEVLRRSMDGDRRGRL